MAPPVSSYCRWPHRCCAAWRVTPSRTAISAHEHPAFRSPVTAWLIASSSSGDEPGPVGQGVNVTGCHPSGVGADDAADERGVLVVLDRPPSPVWCQPGLDAGSPGVVARTSWVVCRGETHLPAPFRPGRKRGERPGAFARQVPGLWSREWRSSCGCLMLWTGRGSARAGCARVEGGGPTDHAVSRAGLIAEHARRAAPGRPRRGRTPGAKRGRARRRAAPLLILNAAQFGSALRKSVSALSTRRSRRVRATPSRTMSMPPMIWTVILSDRMAAPRMTATMGSR